jgi:hypothetical protein
MSETEFDTYVQLRGLDFEGYAVPLHTRGSLERYFFNRLEPGGFVTCMLVGDLERAQYRADSMNRIAIPEIDRFIREQIPEEARGSIKAVNDWIYGEK